MYFSCLTTFWLYYLYFHCFVLPFILILIIFVFFSFWLVIFLFFFWMLQLVIIFWINFHYCYLMVFLSRQACWTLVLSVMRHNCFTRVFIELQKMAVLNILSCFFVWMLLVGIMLLFRLHCLLIEGVCFIVLMIADLL
jgi:hypothetical protein